MIYLGTCTTTRAIAARKLGVDVKAVVLVGVNETGAWVFTVKS